MQIQAINSTSFGIKFKINKAFIETKAYAQKINKSEELNRSLKILETADSKYVTIEHGIGAENKTFSNFVSDNIKVINTPYDGENAVETTLRAIIDLSNFGGRYKALTNERRSYRPHGE